MALIGTDFSRCLFFTSAFGCKRGDACAFCHHVVEMKLPNARPRKAQRDALKARIWGLLQQLAEARTAGDLADHFFIAKICL